LLCGLEGQSVHDVRDSPKRFIFISRASIDVDTDTGEWAFERFGCYPNSIGKRCYLVEFGRVSMVRITSCGIGSGWDYRLFGSVSSIS